MVPSDLANKYNHIKELSIMGPLSDELLDQELATANIGMCIVHAGSGMKVKILTYSAAGLPIITTRFGAAGYEDVPSLIITDGSKDEIIENIKILLSNPIKAAKIGEKNRTFVAKNYLWTNITSIMKDAYDLAYASSYSQRLYLEPLKPFWLEENRLFKPKYNKHVIIKDKMIEIKRENTK